MRAVELFTGAGGLGIGVSRAGFEPVAVVERDRYCCDTIRENQERSLEPLVNWPLVQVDVRNFDYGEIDGDVDLVSGGPPCQPFSLGGKHRGRLDSRDMFPEAIRAVRELKPRAFLFENVKGLTRPAFANYFEYMRLQLAYPVLVRNPDETWTDHLARLERHHTDGQCNAPAYRIVTRVFECRGLRRAPTPGACFYHRIPQRPRNRMEFSRTDSFERGAPVGPMANREVLGGNGNQQTR